jgi:hypothetical protein
MSKIKLLKIINPLLALIVVIQIFSGIFHDFIMEISYELFKRGHSINGFLLSGLVALHFSLNWNWIKSNYFSRK